jgi:hypothetical protein
MPAFASWNARRSADAVPSNVLDVCQWDFLDGLGACFLADRVSAHAVCDNKEMADALPVLPVGCALDRKCVLIMATLHPNVSDAEVLDLVKEGHGSLSALLFACRINSRVNKPEELSEENDKLLRCASRRPFHSAMRIRIPMSQS